MLIDREVFYNTMRQSDNLKYVEEIQGFVKSTSPVNLFEVMKRLDSIDIVRLLFATNNVNAAKFVATRYVICSSDFLVGFEGFDCYYPKEYSRDAVIKKFIKTGEEPDPTSFSKSVDIFWDNLENLIHY